MTTTIELREYEVVEVPMRASTARDLTRLAAGRLTVGVGAAPGTFTIQASQWVGALVTPELSLLIRPKISMENLFSLLGVGIPQASWQDESFGFSSNRDLLAAISQLFARALQQSVEAGLLRSYRRHEERQMAVRGRIDMREQLRAPGRPVPIACVFDEYTADVVENRILKAACRHLLRVPGVPSAARLSLKRSVGALEEVADVWVEPSEVDRIHFTRLNAHYRPSLRLAQLILRNLSLIDRVGANDASAFLVDMNDLFQRYVTERLTKALRGRLRVDAEPTVYLGHSRRVSMAPDLVFSSGGTPVFVGDTKYKLSASAIGRSGDYYQMLAYVVSLGLRAGVLIYCHDGDDAPTREVVVRNHDARLLTYSLPLAGSSADLELAMKDLADWITGWASCLPTPGATVTTPSRV